LHLWLIWLLPRECLTLILVIGQVLLNVLLHHHVRVHSHLLHLSIHDSLVMSKLDLISGTAVTAVCTDTDTAAYTTSDESTYERRFVTNSLSKVV
jgi:hypothetical protein